MRCAAVELTVAKCDVANIERSGEVSIGAKPESQPRAPSSKGVLLFARDRREQTIPCYPGAALVETELDWMQMHRDEFFVATDRDICGQLLGRVVRGQTALPCCDVPPPPGEPVPGTCVVRKRQLKLEPPGLK